MARISSITMPWWGSWVARQHVGLDDKCDVFCLFLSRFVITKFVITETL